MKRLANTSFKLVVSFLQCDFCFISTIVVGGKYAK